MQLSQLLYIAVLAAGIAAYYVYQQRKIKSEGGMQGVLDRMLQLKFGLTQGERLVGWWRGFYYIGPLAPETQRGTLERVTDAMAGIRYRGLGVHVAVTQSRRLILSREPRQEDLPRLKRESVGDDLFRPIHAFDPRSVPRTLPAYQLFGDNPHMRDALANAPVQGTQQGTTATYELVAVHVPQNATPFLVWLEPAGAAAMYQWEQQARRG